MTAQTSGGSVDTHNPTAGAPGLYAEKTRSLGLISAGVISRAAGEVSWQSDQHRICLALTAIRGTANLGGGPAQPMEFSPGELSFTPGGVSTRTICPPVG